MLGLDAKTLAVPDYEITARLERLLMSVQPSLTGAIPVVPVPMVPVRPTTVNQPSHKPPYPNSNYNNHVRHNTHSAHSRRRSPSPPSRRPDANHRARSVSPSHVGIDPRTY